MLEPRRKRGARSWWRRPTRLVIMLEQDDELVFAAGAGAVPPGAEGKADVPIEGTRDRPGAAIAQRSRAVDRRWRTRTARLASGAARPRGPIPRCSFRSRFAAAPLACSSPSTTLGAAGFDRGGTSASFSGRSRPAAATAAGHRQVGRGAGRLRGATSQPPSRERRRWARELHDETLQSLAGLPRRSLIGPAGGSRGRELAGGGSPGRRREPGRGDHQPAHAHRRAAPGRTRRVRGRRGDREPGRAHHQHAQGIEIDVHLDLAWERGDEPARPHPEAREHALPPRAGIADQRRAPRRRGAESKST